jgi:oligopeptide transport system ATP-binding protein
MRPEVAASDTSTDSTTPFVEVRSLVVEFRVSARDLVGRPQVLRAVDGVSFTIPRRQTLALVGESGCGKTTIGRTLVRLYTPREGTVIFDGLDMSRLSRAQRQRWSRRVQMIFQDPYAALNPRLKVEDIIREPLRAHRAGSRTEQSARVKEVLELVGLSPTAAWRYPHSFSGGQRQRICIARAIALGPDFVVADEPVSALDVSIQAQIVNLLKDLQDQLGLTLLFISHDLAVVREVAQQVAVMYLGKIVELGPRDAIFGDALHPYTQALLSAVPIPDPPLERARARIVLAGDIPSAVNPPSGCRFHTRCPYAMAECTTIEPILREAGRGRQVACHLIHPPQRVAEASAESRSAPGP